jgi:thiosulfate reductase cytochrome b subunit
MTPYPIYHNVGNGNFANRDCNSCHHRDSILHSPFEVSSYLPGGVVPSTRGYENVEVVGDLVIGDDGSISGVPELSRSDYYILGLNDVWWVDLFGLLIFGGVLLGVSGHAVLRIIASRHRSHEEPELKRVYMYDVYERLWHWVQAFMILYLIFSGLLIHKPHLFGGFGYPFLVNTHNLFGFILLINAFLALFYNLASGRFKQYLPEPKDFFARSIMQVAYYTRGIFKGEHHPFEKTKHKRLNPLQEVTYFAILNVLLPAQVITGIMIYWGQQNWPIFFTALGGLPVLSPVHTGVAWLFASFVVMHVYLTTASGHTPLAAIKSMIVGWEDVEKRKS